MSVPQKPLPMLHQRVTRGYYPEGPGASSAKYVLLCMASFADQDGTNTFLSQATLATYTCMSLSTVKRALARLKDEGMIIEAPSPRALSIPAERRPTQYRLNLENLALRSVAEVRQDQASRQDEAPSQWTGEGVHGERGGGSPRPTTSTGTRSPDKNTSLPVVDVPYEEAHAHADTPGVDQYFSDAQQVPQHDDVVHGDLGEVRDVGEAFFPNQPVLAPGSMPHGPSRFDSAGRPIWDLHGTSYRLNPPTGELEQLGDDEDGEGGTRHGEAEPPPSQPPGTSEGEAPGKQVRGRENGAQRPQLQNPDGAADMWRPHEGAYATARRIAPDVSLDLLITKYWLHCHEKKMQPTSSHWMKWVIDEQKQIIDAERREKRQAAVNERRSRQWYAVAD